MCSKSDSPVSLNALHPLSAPSRLHHCSLELRRCHFSTLPSFLGEARQCWIRCEIPIAKKPIFWQEICRLQVTPRLRLMSSAIDVFCSRSFWGLQFLLRENFLEWSKSERKLSLSLSLSLLHVHTHSHTRTHTALLLELTSKGQSFPGPVRDCVRCTCAYVWRYIRSLVYALRLWIDRTGIGFQRIHFPGEVYCTAASVMPHTWASVQYACATQLVSHTRQTQRIHMVGTFGLR